MKLSRIITLFLTGAMLFGTIGCANETGGAAPASEAAPAENATPASEAAPAEETAPASEAAPAEESAPAGEQIVLRMAVMTGMQEYFTLADNYMAEYPNVKIEIEEYPTSEFAVLLKAKLAGGDCWDVFSCNVLGQSTMANGGHAADLSDMTDVIERYKYPEGVLQNVTHNGIVVALPAQYQYMPLYYNKAMFADMDLTVPTDYQQLLEIVAKANEAGITPIAGGFKEDWVCFNYMNQFAATYMQQDDPGWGEKRRNNEVTFAGTQGWIDTFDMMKDLINNGAFSDSAVSTSDEQAMMAFLNGESLLYFNGTWGLNAMLEAKADDFDFGGFRFPVNQPGEEACTSTSVTGDFAVWSGSPNLEEAKKWLAYTLSPEQNLIFNTTKGPSPFKDVEVPLHDAFVEFEQTLADSGGKTAEWPAFSQGWPDGMPWPEPGFAMTQELFYPDLARDSVEILEAMDQAYDEAVAALG